MSQNLPDAQQPRLRDLAGPQGTRPGTAAGIYTAPSAKAAEAGLDAFERGFWGHKFLTVVAAWRRAPIADRQVDIPTALFDGEVQEVELR